jgi:hypothetical protein
MSTLTLQEAMDLLSTESGQYKACSNCTTLQNK